MHLQGAAGGEGGHEGLAVARVAGLGSGDTTVTGGKEDRSATGAELRVRIAQLDCEVFGDRVFVLAVRGRHDAGRSVLVKQVVHDVEEALEVAVLEVVADGDEDGGDAGGDPDGVLDVQTL